MTSESERQLLLAAWVIVRAFVEDEGYIPSRVINQYNRVAEYMGAEYAPKKLYTKEDNV